MLLQEVNFFFNQLAYTPMFQWHICPVYGWRGRKQYIARSSCVAHCTVRLVNINEVDFLEKWFIF
jgi:hypothetical protein